VQSHLVLTTTCRDIPLLTTLLNPILPGVWKALLSRRAQSASTLKFVGENLPTPSWGIGLTHMQTITGIHFQSAYYSDHLIIIGKLEYLLKLNSLYYSKHYTLYNIVLSRCQANMCDEKVVCTICLFCCKLFNLLLCATK
jgi:hypothetical protein